MDLQCVLPIRHLHNNTTTPELIEFGSEITEVVDLNWRDEEAHSMIIVCMAGKNFINRKTKQTQI